MIGRDVYAREPFAARERAVLDRDDRIGQRDAFQHVEIAERARPDGRHRLAVQPVRNGQLVNLSPVAGDGDTAVLQRLDGKIVLLGRREGRQGKAEQQNNQQSPLQFHG